MCIFWNDLIRKFLGNNRKEIFLLVLLIISESNMKPHVCQLVGRSVCHIFLKGLGSYTSVAPIVALVKTYLTFFDPLETGIKGPTATLAIMYWRRKIFLSLRGGHTNFFDISQTAPSLFFLPPHQLPLGILPFPPTSPPPSPSYPSSSSRCSSTEEEVENLINCRNSQQQKLWQRTKFWSMVRAADRQTGRQADGRRTDK